MAERDRIARGETEGEAAQAARREFGNVLLTKEVTRSAWGWAWLGDVGQDLRYAGRTLRKAPGFTAVAVLSLALGIGANTAIFSLVDVLMLRMLPVQEPERLAYMARREESEFTYALWQQIREREDVFDGVFAWSAARFDLAAGGEKQPVSGLYVSGDYFQTLGVRMRFGRALTAADDRRGGGTAGPVAVLSHGFWLRQFGGDRNALGRTLRLDGQQFQVVGVTAPGFFGVEVGTAFDVALPLSSEVLLHPQRPMMDDAGTWWLSIMGRLKPEVSIERGRLQLQPLSAALFRADVPTMREPGQGPGPGRAMDTLELKPAAYGLSVARERHGRALLLLMAMVGVVLLIACANVASLLLARAGARAREVAVRLALGAGRVRIVRQMMTESLALSALSAAFGLPLAWWGSQVMAELLSGPKETLLLDMTPDGRVLVFCLVVALATTLLFGLVPAVRATHVAPQPMLREGNGAIARRQPSGRWGRALVAGQVALALVLLVGAGLFVRSLNTLLTEDSGFRQEGVLLIRPDLRLGRYSPERHRVVCREVLVRLRGIPGAVSASRSIITPISGQSWQWDVRVDVGAGERRVHAFVNPVSPGYFETLGTPLRAGRGFTAQDTELSPRVAVVNETMARKLFGGANPIGKTYREDAPTGASVSEFVTEIVGIAKDAKYQGLREKVPPTIYLPVTQNEGPGGLAGTYSVRYRGASRDVVAHVKEAVRATDPKIGLEFQMLSTQVRESLLQEHLMATLTSLFGLLALLLASIGLYGTVAYTVSRQRGEIGIRMALGARGGAVQWLVLREVVALLAGGVLVGLAGALAGERLVRTMLYGLTPADPVAFVGACGLLLVVAGLATYLPARQAARIDPMVALRHE